MRTITLFDTLQGKEREFIPLSEGKVDIYYCGPTVYNYVHLGNFRPTVTFDLLARVMREVGYEVRLVSNYTDIDDKIIKQAKLEGKSEKELSEFYIKAYEDCLNQLNITPLYCHPKASEYITKMASFIHQLEEKGDAYQSGEDIYFRVSSVKDYGCLSKQNIKDLISGARIDVSDKKESPLDFALWKLTDDDGIKFDTEIGRGRPGWHTECVCMVNGVFQKHLIDIHGGGFDLKFPHHENEIAQSEAMYGTKLANYWMHCGFLLTDGVKMSKSLGNSILAKDVLQRHLGNGVRLFFLTTHYRSPVNYTEENLDSMDKLALRSLSSIRKADYKLQLNSMPEGQLLKEDYDQFLDALCHDLNVANALTVFDREIKEINTLSMKEDCDYAHLGSLVFTLKKFSDILGLSFQYDALTEEDKKLYQEFQEAREQKNFQRSDELRPLLMEKGIL